MQDRSRRRKQPVFDRLARRALRRAEARFAPAFYDLHRQRIGKGLRTQFGCVSVALTAGCAYMPLVVLGRGSVFAAWFGGGVLAYIVLGAVVGTRDGFRARVLPFFERQLGGIDTWLAGEDLLWNSRALDEIARGLGMAPLSAFISGDPLIAGEEEHVRLFDAAEALATVEALLRAGATEVLGGPVISDLNKLRDALALAKKNGVRFSLHLREGSTASGHEMDQRQGSYF